MCGKMPPELPGAKIESAVHELNSKGGTVPLQKYIDCRKDDAGPAFKQEILDPKGPNGVFSKNSHFLEGQDTKLGLNLSELSYSSDFSFFESSSNVWMYGQITVMAEALSSSGGEKHEWHPTWPHTHKKCRQDVLVKRLNPGTLVN